MNVGLYNAIDYVNWTVVASSAGSLLAPPSGHYISAGPDWILQNDQIAWRVPDYTDILDNNLYTVSYSCSLIGGSPAVPCTIRMVYTASALFGSAARTIDLVYTPITGVGVVNQLATHDFTQDGLKSGFDHVTFKLIDAVVPSKTQINIDNVEYYANHYE